MKVFVVTVRQPSGQMWYCGKDNNELFLTKELGGATSFFVLKKAVEYMIKLISLRPASRKFNNSLEVKECFYNADEDSEARTCFH